MSKVEEFLTNIRTLNGFKNAILRGITLDKKKMSAEFLIITDKAYTKEEENTVTTICKNYLPESFSALAKIVKRLPDEEILKDKIYEYVKKSFPAASAFLNYDNIHIDMLTSGANFCFDIASGEQSLFDSGKILDEVSKYLQTVFCGSFYGNVRIIEKQIDHDILEEAIENKEEEETVKIRRFKIHNFSKIDGVDEMPDLAVYIADSLNEEGTFSVCGSIAYIEEKTYVKHNAKTNVDEEKSRFVLTVTDGSGMLRTSYFPKKATLDKIRLLHVGDTIVLTGSNEEFNGYRSFKTVKINHGTPPENFIPEKRQGKPVPKNYHTVFPEQYVDYTQSGLFDDFNKPEDLKKNIFVVFDLETTGLNNNPAMGKMDKIIEIGAVKLINGEMTEKFSTSIACNEKLSKEIINLTGIFDEDLKNAPPIEKAIADFYKFIDGAILVGHNVTFDLRFVQYYGEQNGYRIEHKQLDTLTLAQEVLRGQLTNYKLNTVADYYGFTFNHHRAFDDACVTAKIFIELVKKRGGLPY